MSDYDEENNALTTAWNYNHLFSVLTDSSSSWLVNDAQHIETSDSAGIFSGLALSVVEVGRDSDHGVGDLLSQVSLGNVLHLAQNHGGDFLRSKGTSLFSNIDFNVWTIVFIDNLRN